LATFYQWAKILSQRWGIKKISTTNFVLKSSCYQYFNFKNEFLGSKNGKIVVFIVKVRQGKELLPKIEREK